MSSVLARKWRPKNFQDTIGQTTTINTLTNALTKNRLHHAYLFTGTRGIGKTTLARIFATCLSCEKGITTKPCEDCTMCKNISIGQHIDIVEIDAASKTKVEDTRELLATVNYAPQQARFKLFIIDEVHMLSTHSFNALLKTLEEPPQHVKFLLATTDPQKIPATILSRCLQFHLQSLSHIEITNHLKKILDKESINYETQALEIIAKAATGSVRDALSLLDQAIALTNEKITASAISSMLGHVSQQSLIKLLAKILHQSAAEVMQETGNLIKNGHNCQALLKQLLEIIHQLICHLSIAEIPAPLDTSVIKAWEQASSIEQHEWAHLLYQIGIAGIRDLHLSPSERHGLEITLLRMACLKPNKTTTKAPWWQSKQIEKTKPNKIIEKTRKTNSDPAPTIVSSKTIDNTDMPLTAETWPEISKHIKLSGLARALLTNSKFISCSDNVLVLSAAHQYSSINTKLQLDKINTALKISGYNYRTTIIIQKEESKKASNIKQKKPIQASTNHTAETDDQVQNLLNSFDGKIIE